MTWARARTPRERRDADLFYADLMGWPRRARPRARAESREEAPVPDCGCGGARPSGEHAVEFGASEDVPFADEALVGQAVLGGRTVSVDTAATPLWTGAGFDDGLRAALLQTTAHTCVLGDPYAPAGFAVHEWGPRTSLAAPLAIELDTPRIAALLVNGGDRVYLCADPLATTTAARLRWVHVPGIREFFALPAAQQTSQRRAWIRQIVAAAPTNPRTGAAFTAAELGALSSPLLRVLLARHAAAAFPVGTHARGGVVHGVTLPMLRSPVSEPHVYQRVISMREGKLESINAWDLGAGISLGPVQINAQRAALFRFLWQVWQEDRGLFASALGAAPTWAMRDNAGVTELSVPVAGAAQWLRGLTTTAEVTRNVAWFQSGDPTRSTAAQIDVAHRRDLAARFRQLVAWPHIQALLEDVTSWWLQPGLDLVHAAGIPRLDPLRPDRDTFILKSMLMSTYVRYSGCLQPLLDALARWTSVADKLANWRTAVSTMTGPCRGDAGATAEQRARHAILVPRLEHQQADAAEVFTALQALFASRSAAVAATAAATAATAAAAASGMGVAGAAMGAAAGAAVGAAAADRAATRDAAPRGAAPRLSPAEVARIFDAAHLGDPSLARAAGLRIVAGPGESVPWNLPSRTWLVTRALGEGRFAELAELHGTETGEWELRGLRGSRRIPAPHRLGRDRLLLVEDAEDAPPITRCGFFGPHVARTESEVRAAVVAAAQAEWTRWHTAAGAPRRENEAAMFGDLVRYYLAVISGARPDTLTAMQAAAVAGTTSYGTLFTTTDAAVVDAEAARVRAVLLAGAPGTTTPANLAAAVEDALKHARQANRDAGAFRAWSAVWVSHCVRGAAIGLGLEAMIQGNHSGRDELLRVSAAHRVYALTAHQRRVGSPRRDGTYHAFAPDAHPPRPGDIIVQDRQHDDPAQLMTFARIAELAGGLETHGDIVVEVPEGAGFAIAIGGNLGGSVRKRRYPLDASGRLVRAAAQLYTQESNTGALPAVPATSTAALASTSTLRIFTLLRPVEVCAAVPGQPWGGGVLT